MLKNFETLWSKPTLFRIRRRSWWLKEEKNCVISKAIVLVYKFFTQPDQMMWVKVTLASVEEQYLRPPSWQRWTKLLEIDKNWSHSPIIFSNIFLVVLSKTIGQNDFVELYDILFSLGIIIVVDVLKWDS